MCLEFHIYFSNIRFDVVLVIYTEFALTCLSSAKGLTCNILLSFVLVALFSLNNIRRKAKPTALETNCSLFSTEHFFFFFSFFFNISLLTKKKLITNTCSFNYEK